MPIVPPRPVIVGTRLPKTNVGVRLTAIVSLPAVPVTFKGSAVVSVPLLARMFVYGLVAATLNVSTPTFPFRFRAITPGVAMGNWLLTVTAPVVAATLNVSLPTVPFTVKVSTRVPPVLVSVTLPAAPRLVKLIGKVLPTAMVPASGVAPGV